MSRSRNIAAVAGTLMLLGSFSASAVVEIFKQDFEMGLGGNEFIAIDPGEGTGGIDTRWVTCEASCPFSVTRNTTVGDSNFGKVRNFDVHHQNTNPYAGGDAGEHTDMYWNENMDGQVLGHVKANYNWHEDNYYQIDAIHLNANLTDINLMFDFDSWISKDGYDGFAVAINDGTGWDLLTPNGDSDMQYITLSLIGDPSLNAMTGAPAAQNDPSIGYNGWFQDGTGDDMAGTAMFDIADTYAGRNISLRFAFASGGTYEYEGINIDNIKLTGVCRTGEEPNCTPPGGGNSVPAPASIALAAFGVMAVRRRRRRA